MSKTYLEFEKKITQTVDKMFFSEVDPQVKEMLRLETLRQRVFAKRYWEKIGKEVPPRLNFVKENNDD
jgi:hypothetical protein|tara:strand:+ start:320 stop:523 length:204 start_codon:yes stop_codon:yes gene_type:complete